MSVPALLQSLGMERASRSFPASFGICSSGLQRDGTYLALSIVLQGSIFTKSLNNNSLTVGGSAIALPPQPVSVPSMTALSQSAIIQTAVSLSHSHLPLPQRKGKTFRFCSCKWRKVVRKVGASAYRHNGFNFNFSICRNKPLYCKVWCCGTVGKKIFFATEQ